MARGLERGALVAGMLVITGSLLFVLGLAGPAFFLVAALAAGVAGTLLWAHFELSAEAGWLPILLLSLVTLICTLVLELAYKPSFGDWFAVVLTLAASGTTLWLQRRHSGRCDLCHRRLSSSAVIFQCPRCGMRVCDVSCWSFDHRRCQLCLEQRVPVLPLEESWWMRGCGPRARQGRCQVCLGTADAVDLRACPNCRRLQCREDWDFANGECTRCGAVLPNLPPSLRTVTATINEA